MDKSNVETVDTTWKGVYRLGGAAALLSAVMWLIASSTYVIAYRAGPPPTNILEWFAQFQSNWFVGLIFLGFADIVFMILAVPISLALYIALQQVSKAWSLIATALAFVGLTDYLATNAAFSMLTLSNQYAAATTEAQKSLLQAAGQGLIASTQGTSYYMGLPLVWLASIILSVLMWRHKGFGKASAYVGILGYALLLIAVPLAGYATTDPATAVETVLAYISYLGGGVLWVIWWILIGLKLLKLGRIEGKMLPQQSRSG